MVPKFIQDGTATKKKRKKTSVEKRKILYSNSQENIIIYVLPQWKRINLSDLLLTQGWKMNLEYSL